MTFEANLAVFDGCLHRMVSVFVDNADSEDVQRCKTGVVPAVEFARLVSTHCRGSLGSSDAWLVDYLLKECAPIIGMHVAQSAVLPDLVIASWLTCLPSLCITRQVNYISALFTQIVARKTLHPVLVPLLDFALVQNASANSFHGEYMDLMQVRPTLFKMFLYVFFFDLSETVYVGESSHHANQA
jgi:hypothetical protein